MNGPVLIYLLIAVIGFTISTILWSMAVHFEDSADRTMYARLALISLVWPLVSVIWAIWTALRVLTQLIQDAKGAQHG